MSTEVVGDEELKPLKIKCRDTECERNLHWFVKATQKNKGQLAAHCWKCKRDLVDWGRVRKRSLKDVEHTFESLKFERVRHIYWHRKLDQRAENYARRKGKKEMWVAAETRIIKSVGAAEPARDGRQTGWENNPLFYAQHATATCCRRCIEKWHGIKMGKPLSKRQVKYLTRLIMLYIEDRLPDLAEEGVKVPPIRRSPSAKAQKSEGNTKKDEHQHRHALIPLPSTSR